MPEVETIQAKENPEKTKDNRGFFVINMDRNTSEVVLEHHLPDGRLTKVIRGKNAKSIYDTVIRQGLISRFETAANLGSELEKAVVALRNNLTYVQETELPMMTSTRQQEIPAVHNTKVPDATEPRSPRRELKEGIVQNRQQKKKYRQILTQIRVDSFFA